MKDQIMSSLGSFKEYAIEMASSVLGLSISKVLLHNPYDQDEDIESIMEYLITYDLVDHYEDPTSRSSSYYYYKYYNLPVTIKIIKNATERGKLNREKWMPCLELFFEKTKVFLEDVPEDLDEYIESLKQYEN